MFFSIGKELRNAVDGRRRTEDNALDLFALHGAEQATGADDVVIVIVQRFCDGILYCLQAGEMDHGRTIVLGQRALDRLLSANVTFNGDHRLSTDLLDPLQRFTVAVRKIFPKTTTCSPLSRSSTHAREPIYPAPPVTRIILCLFWSELRSASVAQGSAMACD